MKNALHLVYSENIEYAGKINCTPGTEKIVVTTIITQKNGKNLIEA